MYIVSQPADKRLNFKTTIISIIFPKNKRVSLHYAFTCVVGQGDVIGGGDVGRQGGVEVLHTTDWVASRCTVVEIEMVKAESGKQGGLSGEGGGQEEDGDEGGEEDDGADKSGAFEQAAFIRMNRHQHRGCEKGGYQ